MTMIKKENIQYLEGGKELLPEAKTLWEALNQMHHDCSKHFKDKYTQFTYEMRCKGFERADQLKVVIAINTENDERMGYSISSITKELTGEIDSIYLDDSYRGLKIGEELMAIPLKWMEDQQVKRTILGVAVGNEDVYPFYEKFGFYPKATILERL